MRANKTQATASTVAGMGGYGCMVYNATGAATVFVPEVDERHIAVVQAFEDTVIKHVNAAWNAPASVDGITLPAGDCLFVKAASVEITDGVGIIYYGAGNVIGADAPVESES